MLPFALPDIDQRLGRHPLGLTEADRFKVPDDVIRAMRSAGQWRSLDEPAEKGPLGLTGHQSG